MGNWHYFPQLSAKLIGCYSVHTSNLIPDPPQTHTHPPPGMGNLQKVGLVLIQQLAVLLQCGCPGSPSKCHGIVQAWGCRSWGWHAPCLGSFRSCR
jgi:hypothetical protein